jgi:chorismate mutase / prephenate dehydratase
MSLEHLRQALDSIDNDVLSLLARRASIILQVADFKKQHGGLVHDPERENAIIARLSHLNPGPLPAEAVERIYRKIIEEMRNFEAVVHDAS